jgi:hypothetical protein
MYSFPLSPIIKIIGIIKYKRNQFFIYLLPKIFLVRQKIGDLPKVQKLI